jgi:hypothetical protein
MAWDTTLRLIERLRFGSIGVRPEDLENLVSDRPGR